MYQTILESSRLKLIKVDSHTFLLLTYIGSQFVSLLIWFSYIGICVWISDNKLIFHDSITINPNHISRSKSLDNTLKRCNHLWSFKSISLRLTSLLLIAASNTNRAFSDLFAFWTSKIDKYQYHNTKTFSITQNVYQKYLQNKFTKTTSKKKITCNKN